MNREYEQWKPKHLTESLYLKGWKYIVWVGGVGDYYKDYDKALKHYLEWIDKGYDDVVMEKI